MSLCEERQVHLQSTSSSERCFLFSAGTPEAEASPKDGLTAGTLGGPSEKNRKLQKKWVSPHSPFSSFRPQTLYMMELLTTQDIFDDKYLVYVVHTRASRSGPPSSLCQLTPVICSTAAQQITSSFPYVQFYTLKPLKTPSMFCCWHQFILFFFCQPSSFFLVFLSSSSHSM